MVDAYIADSVNGKVYVLDISTNTISNTITTRAQASGTTSGVAVTPDSKKVYITNYGTAGPGSDGLISVIDTSTNTISATIDLGLDTHPVGIAIVPGGSRAYVAQNTNSTASKVNVIDTSNNTVLATITVGLSPLGVAITPNGKKVYIANNGTASDNKVSVIDTSSNTVSATITVGSLPQGIAISPNGAEAYVTNNDSPSGTVSVINTSTDTISATITVGQAPYGVAFTPDGKYACVVNFGVGVGGTLSVIDTSTRNVTATIAGFAGGRGVSITSDSKKAYITTGATYVNVIDLTMDTISATITCPVNSDPSSFGNFIQPDLITDGDFMNKFRNAAFNVWQRGTSGTITAGSPAYTADGWIVGCTGANVPWAQTAGRNATRYGLKITGATSVTDVLVKQRIESFLAAQLYPGASAQVTVQAKVYNNTGSAITPTLTIKHAGSADNWSSPTTDVNAVSLQSCPNAALTTVAYTFASVSGTANGLEATIDFGNNFSSNAKSVEVFEWDIRVTAGVATGLNSSPPTPEFLPISLEYAVSQYYLPAINTGGNSVTGIAQGECTSSTAAFITFFTPVATRVPVTGISISSASHFGVSDSTGAAHTCTSVTFASANLNSYSVNLNVASGLSAGNATQLQTTSSSANLVFTGAEL